MAAPLVVVPLADAVTSAVQALGSHGSRIETRGLAGKANTAPALLATSLEGLLLYATKTAATERVTVTARATNREAVIEIAFDGIHPASALTSLAFVELGPAVIEEASDAKAGDRNRPYVGLGPALVSRVSAALGWRLELVTDPDRAARVLLALPASPPP